MKQRQSFEELIKTWLDLHSKPYLATHDDNVRRARRISAELGHYKANSITPLVLQQYHAKISQKTRTEANRQIELIASVFERGVLWGIVKTNPAKQVRKNREKSRARFLNSEEMMRLFAVLDDWPSPRVRLAIKLLVATGCRKSEILSARWADYCPVKKTLTIDETKNGTFHVVPLSDFCVAELESSPREGEFIICGRFGGAFREINRAWRKIRLKAEIPDVRLHDLRRTVGSWLAIDGASLPVIGQVLNHKSVQSTAVYARVSQIAARGALDRLSSLLQACEAAIAPPPVDHSEEVYLVTHPPLRRT